ncbi:nucleotidyltransferase family protein [Croceicoccus mobilis]|uniref:MobA-like NTP transferase domain-containing protein n=1 Tax=Croceicoccus mobilis TaxID=1703339 RepID=A0A916YRC3_9SPHN|nr:NTP transferase domain-containing protein [Croceicoccus mobilis]GGD56962.1 hypothetical protein GCM10010990_02730 [Croceicoccus mobilis]
MIAAREIFAVTLAAGLSTRFGGDKLAARLGGTNVLDASLKALEGFDWAGRGIVLDPRRAAGWSGGLPVIPNPAPESGMGHSLALAARAAMDAGAAHLLVTLGDMPNLSRGSIARLLAEAPAGPDSLAVMVPPGGKPAPPAIFGASWLPRLAETRGDSGARAILRNPAHAVRQVALSASEAIDIDTREDIERLR